MIVDPDQEYWIQNKKGRSCFSKRKADCLVLAPKWCHLNRVDPSFMNSVAGSYLQGQVAQISYMIPVLQAALLQCMAVVVEVRSGVVRDVQL
jgi:hypothetical protein